MASARRNQMEDAPRLTALKRSLWVVLTGGWLFTLISLAGYSPYDPPSHFAAPLNEQPANWCGWAGAMVAYQSYLMLGVSAWLALAGIAALLWVIAKGKDVDQLGLRVIGVILMTLSFGGFLSLLAPRTGPMPEGAGGLIALFIVEQLSMRFSTLGTALVLMMVFGVGATLAFDQVVMALPNVLASLGRWLSEINWPKPVLVGQAFRSMVSWPSLPWKSKEPAPAPRKRASRNTVVIEDPDSNETVTVATVEDPLRRKIRNKNAQPLVEDPDRNQPEEPPASISAAAVEIQEEQMEEAQETAAAAETGPEVKKAIDTEALREKIRKLPITFAQSKPPKPLPPRQQDLSGYRFPGPEFLIDPESNFNEEMAKLVREQAEILERSLRTYKIEAEVVAIDAGPVITLYEVQLAPGTKVSAISAVSSDVARELKAQNIRIVPNTAGKSTVGIEVPNLKKEKVRLKELMALAGSDINEKMSLPMFLGKDASGNPLIADLARMPHMLIAGTTGSGKSVCINSIIMSFLYARRPDELKLVLVDPKMVEMAQFRDIPHLMCPVITEMHKAAAILEWAVTKMDERYELLAEAAVRDIDSYNKLSWEDKKERFNPSSPEEEMKIPKKLPRMVFVIDELADLMMTNKEVESFIVRIAQKARAVGIHLILATQRPQANVVTGLIKSNMPCRVAFKVASGMDSRIVLDQKGAELLLGQGDMLYLSPGTSKLMRSQGTLVDDAEVRSVVKFLKNEAQQAFEPELIQLRAPSGEPGEEGLNPAEKDPLFEQAVEIVLETKRGSVSLLQRRLAIGYSRSSRLIEQMGEAGILGEYKGSQAREVNITIEEWEAMKQQIAADQAASTGTANPEAELEKLAEAAPAPVSELKYESEEEQKLADMAQGDEIEEDDDDSRTA